MERDTQLLIAHDPLTAEEARRQTFPTTIRGLDRTSVEDFQHRAANQLYDREQEIAQLTEQVAALRAELDGRPAPHPDAGHGGVDVLARATLQADAIIRDAQAEAHDILQAAQQQHEAVIAEAQQQAGTIAGRARQQAGSIVGRATQEAERAADRIRREAPVQAQRATAYYTALAAEARAGIIDDLDSLGEKLQKWSAQAQQGPEPPETDATRRPTDR